MVADRFTPQDCNKRGCMAWKTILKGSPLGNYNGLCMGGRPKMVDMPHSASITRKKGGACGQITPSRKVEVVSTGELRGHRITVSHYKCWPRRFGNMGSEGICNGTTGGGERGYRAIGRTIDVGEGNGGSTSWLPQQVLDPGVSGSGAML